MDAPPAKAFCKLFQFDSLAFGDQLKKTNAEPLKKGKSPILEVSVAEYAKFRLEPGLRGFSAQILPFFRMEMGVPCMRAVLRVTLAVRHVVAAWFHAIGDSSRTSSRTGDSERAI